MNLMDADANADQGQAVPFHIALVLKGQGPGAGGSLKNANAAIEAIRKSIEETRIAGIVTIQLDVGDQLNDGDGA